MGKPTLQAAALSSVLVALALAGCFREPYECRQEECHRKKYGISTRLHLPYESGPRIDTLDAGRLYVEVQIQADTALAKRSAMALSCIGCEEFFRNSSLHFDRPLLAGSDTLAAFTNLLDSTVVAKIGIGSRYTLLFDPEVRFKAGTNRIRFTSDLVLPGGKIGSVDLERTLHVGEGSSW